MKGWFAYSYVMRSPNNISSRIPRNLYANAMLQNITSFLLKRLSVLYQAINLNIKFYIPESFKTDLFKKIPTFYQALAFGVDFVHLWWRTFIKYSLSFKCVKVYFLITILSYKKVLMCVKADARLELTPYENELL